ncbi:DUF2946 family protein [Piscinibacter sp. HJYY11]|uniref:DUF2946 family protein n=1 Tax=Piscinibacter sp. HJYY11 TaxID=2801333 RepID=UPI00191EBD62|nr:DUF2946 family protein [Piscinibacter sp. HJYY11]MBL0728491.1 DUF2946 family protein [Piscinibacter sp. HJYY11]
MSRRPFSAFNSRFAVWLFACALLLKAAVPLLASTSAEAQGKALVEVCTVYGVKTIALDGEPAPDHQATHAGDHCALSAVMALAAPQLAAADSVAPPVRQVLPAPRAATTPPDASTRWRARLKQGPPALA